MTTRTLSGNYGFIANTIGTVTYVVPGVMNTGGTNPAVYLYGSDKSLIVSGTLAGGAGVKVRGGEANYDSITVAQGGTIEATAGSNNGIWVGGATYPNKSYGFVVNSGVIQGFGGGSGIDFEGGGNLTNNAGGVVLGVYAKDQPNPIYRGLTVINAGSIAAAAGGPGGAIGAHRVSVLYNNSYTMAGGGGLVVNSGTISSNQVYGIGLYGGGTVVNSGVIFAPRQLAVALHPQREIGSQFYYSNRLVIYPSSTIVGVVYLGGGILDLESNGNKGTTGISLDPVSSYTGLQKPDHLYMESFYGLNFGSGGQWSVTVDKSLMQIPGLGQGIITGFTAGDTLTVAGIATPTSFTTNVRYGLAVAAAQSQTSGVTNFASYSGGLLTSGTAGPLMASTSAQSSAPTVETELTLVSGGVAVDTLVFGGKYNFNQFSLNASGALVSTLCFLPGTLIDTPNGQVAIERLRAGEMVRTLRNGDRVIKWIGHGQVLAARGRRCAATPVIVRKGALGGALPIADLRITKAHSLYIDDVLIPVEFLVNHRTILWDDNAQEVTVYHIELNSHDVIFANGTPAETFRDDGNGWLFQNGSQRDWSHEAMQPYAPVVTGGPIVDRTWRRILDLAGPRPGIPTTEEADIHLLADGVRVDPFCQDGSHVVFRLAARPAVLAVVSRAGCPCELGIARDPRLLGVALRSISAMQDTLHQTIGADDDGLASGFHGFEPELGWRWTNGSATIPTALFDGFDQGAVNLVADIASTTTYVLEAEGTRAA